MTEFRRIAIAAAVLTIFAAGGLTAYQVADIGQKNAAAQNETATNESLVVEYDAWQYVDAGTAQYTTGFYNNSITVYNRTNATLTRGEDYKWNNSDGTILYLNTSDTEEGNTSYVSYKYTANTEAVKKVSGPLSATVRAIGWVGVLAAGISLVVLLLAFGGLIVSKIGTANTPRSNR